MISADKRPSRLLSCPQIPSTPSPVLLDKRAACLEEAIDARAVGVTGASVDGRRPSFGSPASRTVGTEVRVRWIGSDDRASRYVSSTLIA